MVTYSVEEDKLVCSFSENLNTVNCSKFEKEICNKVSLHKGSVVFDLKDVDYIASMFLRICVRVSKDAGSENFSFINVSPSVKKVFKISGFDKFINIK